MVSLIPKRERRSAPSLARDVEQGLDERRSGARVMQVRHAGAEDAELPVIKRCDDIAALNIDMHDVLRSSDMVAIPPSRLVAGVDGLVTSTPPFEFPGFSKMAVWHERTHRDPDQRWMREVLFETCS